MKLQNAESLLIDKLFRESLSVNRLKVDSSYSKKNIDLKIKKLSGDASTRKYYRIKIGELSYVVCLDTPLENESNRYPFCEIQRFLMERGIRVPNVYDIDGRAGYILEEDLGDITLLKRLSHIESIRDECELYEKCVSMLIALHKISLEQKVSLPMAILKNGSFDTSKLQSELGFTVEYFLKRFLKVKLSNLDQEVLNLSFEIISNQLSEKKHVLTHRDFHSRNIMVKQDELVMIDFQDARMGIPQYDLVSLLEDCYYQLDEENKNNLVSKYWNEFAANFSGQTKGEFTYLYDLMTIQRIFKAVGSFAFIYTTRRDKRYIKFIGYAMESIKSKLLKYPELNDLRRSIFKYYYAS